MTGTSVWAAKTRGRSRPFWLGASSRGLTCPEPPAPIGGLGYPKPSNLDPATYRKECRDKLSEHIRKIRRIQSGVAKSIDNVWQ